MTGTVESTRLMTLAEAAQVTQAIRSNADQLWGLLLTAHEGRAWVPLGYGSWRDYATTEFGIGQSRAYQLLDAARVSLAIAQAASSTDVEISEAEARDLKPILAEVVEDIAVRTADASPDEVPSIVRDVISDARSDRRERAPFTDGYDRALADFGRLAARFTRLHCDDEFTTHRPSLGRRHLREIERHIQSMQDVARDLRAGLSQR